jgi:hypothetical protein
MVYIQPKVGIRSIEGLRHLDPSLRRGSEVSALISGIGLELMLAFLAPHDQPNAAGGSIAERHRPAGVERFHFGSGASGPAPVIALIRLFRPSANSAGVLHSSVLRCLISKCSLGTSSARHVGMTISPSPSANPPRNKPRSPDQCSQPQESATV